MSTLTTAISLYISDGGAALGNTSTSYVSLPDASATTTAGDQCQAQNPPSLPSGYVYHCSSSSMYRANNGTGWVPVNFQSISSGAPIGALPVDPLNTSSTGNYYAYFTNGVAYEVTTPLESTKYALAATVDGGTYSNLYEQGTNLALAPASQANTTISFDNAATATANNVASVTSSITVGSGSNELLAILLTSGNVAISSVSVDGVAPTLAVHLSQTRSVSIYYVTGLSAGVHNVTTTFAANNNVVMTLASFFGINQSSPYQTSTSIAAATATPSSSITTTKADELLVSAVYYGSADAPTISTGQNVISQDKLIAGSYADSGYTMTTATGTYTHSYTTTGGSTQHTIGMSAFIGSWQH